MVAERFVLPQLLTARCHFADTEDTQSEDCGMVRFPNYIGVA
jgi:hypothetical protein